MAPYHRFISKFGTTKESKLNVYVGVVVLDVVSLLINSATEVVVCWADARRNASRRLLGYQTKKLWLSLVEKSTLFYICFSN